MSKSQNDNSKINLFTKLISNNDIGTMFPLIVLCIVISIVNSDFLMINNLADILRTASFTFIVAIPVTYLLISGGMDMSIGAVTSLGSVMAALFMVRMGLPPAIGVVLALLCGAVIGLFNGIIITRFNFPPFIVTLGTQYIVNGFLAIITTNNPIAGLPEGFKVLGQGKIGAVLSFTVIIALVLGVLGWLILSKTKYGRSVFAVGGNRETAYLAGINVKKVSVSVYVLTSIFSALSGILMCSRFSSGQPACGTGSEMTIMAAVIIGGTSLFGGVGSVIGSAIGCIMFAVITNGLIFMKISTLWQNLIFGIILLISIGLDAYRRKVNGKA